MQPRENFHDKRRNGRLDRALRIMLSDQDGTTVNISADGVYFEIITDNKDTFLPGAIIHFQVCALATTSTEIKRELTLKGHGTVIRSDIIYIAGHGFKLGVALQYRGKLDIMVGKSLHYEDQISEPQRVYVETDYHLQSKFD